MFSRLFKRPNHNAQTPTGVGVNPLKARLDADFAALQAGADMGETRAAWRALCKESENDAESGIAGTLPHFYDYLLAKVDEALDGRLNDGTGLAKFAETLASRSVLVEENYATPREADRVLTDYAPAICQRIEAALAREWPPHMQAGAWLEEMLNLFFHHAHYSNDETHAAPVPLIVPFLRRFPEHDNNLLAYLLDRWGDEAALADVLAMAAESLDENRAAGHYLWMDMMGALADKHDTVHKKAVPLLKTLLKRSLEWPPEKRENLLRLGLGSLYIKEGDENSRREALLCINRDKTTRACLKLLAGSLPKSALAQTIEALLAAAEVLKSQPKTYDLKQTPSVPFADFGLKLAVIDELMYRSDRLKPRLLLDTFAKEYDKRLIDREADGYAVIPEIRQYFKNLDIPQGLLDTVTELYIDGGLNGGSALYEEMWPFFDPGCGDTLLKIGAKAIDDLPHLPNLRRIVGLENCRPPKALIKALRDKGVTLAAQDADG